MRKALLFDFDGTLADSEYHAWRMKKEYMMNHGISIQDDQLMATVGMNFTQTMNHLFPDLSQAQKDMFLFEWKQAKQEISMKHLLFPEVLPLLRELKKENRKVAVVSNRDSKSLYYVLHECELIPYIDCIISRDMVEHAKPHPQMFQLAMKELQTQPEECIVIEDSQIGIDAGRNSGAYVLGRTETRLPLTLHGADEMFIHHHEILDILYHIT